MDTLAQPPDSDEPPPDAVPYFRRLAEFHEAAELAAAERGLPPEPWAA